MSDFPSANYAGIHLVVDFWGVLPDLLSEEQLICQALMQAAKDAKINGLYSHFNHYENGPGIIGILVLDKGHVSIHTWPEIEYAAIDIFLCNISDPDEMLPALIDFFKPEKVYINKLWRGIKK